MPLNPSQTRELLDKLEHQPNKKLGQNFLVDGNIVRKSIELAEVSATDRVVEIGPGLGTLSQAILKTGASVWAVERDASLAKHLRENIQPQAPDFHLIEGDCLDSPRAGLDDLSDGYKIVANLPYAVSTPWMEAVLAGPLPSCMVLMLQKEAGDRYSAQHGTKNFGAISIFLQSAYSVTGRHLVAAPCFYPAPKVDSVLLRLELKRDFIRFPENARECVRRIFTQRRKQLGTLCKKDPEAHALAWFESMIKEGISPNIRPEDLALEHWQSFAKRMS
ncbi:MAG: 16S rRNA (adenine(1518)-N(6)/adenine(1519)-N(6))-dimethyltransferase RsmA [Verrucomicrobiota bacterium]